MFRIPSQGAGGGTISKHLGRVFKRRIKERLSEGKRGKGKEKGKKRREKREGKGKKVSEGLKGMEK